MICVVSTSGLEKVVSACGAETTKAMLLIEEKPVCADLFDELQRLEEFFEKVILVGSNLKEFEDWTKFGMHDEFFKTKLMFLKDENAECLDDDIYGAFDWLSSKGIYHDVLVVRPDLYALDLGKLTDETLGSFRAHCDGRPLNIWKLKNFVDCTNLMISLQESNSWSLEKMTETLFERGLFEDIDIPGAVLPLKTRQDYIEIWKRRRLARNDGPVACEIDTKKQTIKLSNAWKSKRWSSEVWKTERCVQSALWDQWDFLHYATPQQRPFLPAVVDRGPNVRGEYCNWIEIQLIPDSSIQAMMMGRSMDEESWKEVIEKALDVLEEHFWMETEPDWRSDADRKDRMRYIECLSDRWTDLISAKVPTFSIIKWDTLLKRHLEWMENHVKDRKSVFHNGTAGRLVHGGLSLKNILCNWQTLDMHFVDPSNRTGILVDTFSEYAGFYADCWCLLPVFIHGRHVDCGAEGLDVPDYIAANAYSIESILNARLGEKAIQAKVEALMLALEQINFIPDEHRKAFMAFLQYRANELYVGSIHSRTIMEQPKPCDQRCFARCPKAFPTIGCIKEEKRCQEIRNRMYKSDIRPICIWKQ